jgi:uncharacterized protein
MLKTLDSVIVKPVGAKCNLNCDYCFYLEKEALYPDTKVMDEHTLRVLLEQMSEQSGMQYNITWQGGEPTLAGLDFYKEVVDLQQYYGRSRPKTIGNSIQTNGTLLSEEWIPFLRDYSFLVGLSIDGPEKFHDHWRKYRNGNGSFFKVLEMGRSMQKHQIAVNVLSCISSTNVKAPHELYDFFKDEGYQWLQFNPVFERNDSGSIHSSSVDPKDLGKFMCLIFDLWFMDFVRNQQAPVIRFIENAFHSHLGMESPECSFKETCGVYLVVEHNGDVYSCDFFVNENTLLGNIHEDRLIDLLNSSQQQNFGERKKILSQACLKCNYRTLCNGGCPKYRNPNSHQHHFCEAYKIFHKYSAPRFNQLVKAWKANNPARRAQTFDAGGLM